MTTSVFLAPTPILQFFNNLGQPNAGGSVLTQVGGVNYPTYEDSAGSTPLPNPIPLNSRGEVSNSSGISTQLFLESGVVYTFTLYDASHNQINQATWMGSNFIAASDYSNGYLNRVVNSISDLRAIKSSSYTRVFVTGYYSSGDGGGGAYWYDPTDTTSADNGGTIIVATDGGRWKLEQIGLVRTSQFGAVGSGDETTYVNNAFTWAISTGKAIWIDKALTVSQAVVNGASGLTIHSTGSLTGLSTGTYDAVFTIKNSSDVTVTGRLPVSGAYNTGYACAVACYTDNSTQAAKLNLQNIITVGAQLGWRFGRSTEPGALISEITVNGGYSYGCTSLFAAYGTQTVVDVIGYQAISDLGSNPAGWSSLARIVAQVYGANLRFTGGEFILADVTTGVGALIQPIADPVNGNQYGSISLNGVEIECASQWCLIQNPSSIGSLVAGMGGLSMTGCKGVHTQNLFPMVQVSDSAFPGTIKIDSSNKFFCTAARTIANVNCSGTTCDVYVDDGAFGKNFIQGLSGIIGGVAHFDRRKILDTQNTNGQLFASVTPTTVVYTVNNSDINTGRFLSDYSTSTGKFTVPPGGLLDVEVFASLHTTLPASPLDLMVQINGVQRTPWPTSLGGANCNGWVGGQTMIGNLNAGDVVDVIATQSGGSNSNGNGAAWEKFVIYARN